MTTTISAHPRGSLLTWLASLRPNATAILPGLGTAFLFAVALAVGVAGVVEAQGPYACTGTVFADVSADTVGEAFCGYIEHFATLGITSGCAVSPPLYCPAEPVTRAQMAVFVTRALDQAPGGDITAVNPGFGLTGGGTSGAVTLAVDTGAVQARVTGTCPTGQSIRAIDPAGAVTCQADTNSGGTVTSVASGFGLSGGPITTTGTLAVDTETIQRRVAGSCDEGSSIRVVNADGSVKCEPDTDSGGTVMSIDTGAGLTGGPITTSGTVAVSFAGPGAANTVARSDHTHAAPGSANTAVGTSALATNTTGSDNTAVGSNALLNNATAVGNTAVGSLALLSNTTGGANSALGAAALVTNTTGSDNTAVGASALASNTGNGNTAVGNSAGFNATTGSNNIYIANRGVAAEAATIRVGISGTQTRAFVAGIRGVSTGMADAITVLIDSNGQLGTVSSSRRVKDEIRDMGDASAGLLRLRPVTFRYTRSQVDARREYGLIAEEVAEVYPDLVVHSATGEVETVQYHKLVPMLLNELQRQMAEIAELRRDQAALGLELARLTEVLARLARFETAASPH